MDGTILSESSSTPPPSVSSAVANSANPTLSPSQQQGGSGDPRVTGDDAHYDNEAILLAGLSDEASGESASDASPPQNRSRGKRLDRRSTSQKRLHPPHVDQLGSSKKEDTASRLDPSRVIPTELLFRCTNYLDAPSLLRLQLTSTHYRDLARRNEAGWADLCVDMWRDKAAIAFRAPPASDDTPQYEPPDNWMHAYFASIVDSKRTYLTAQDVVFDPPGDSNNSTDQQPNHEATTTGPAALLHRLRNAHNVWSFRFKASSGTDWTAHDPWYLGEPCRKFAFMSDGSILQYVAVAPADAARKKADRSGSSGRPLLGSTSESGDAAPSAVTSYELKDPAFPMRWRFLTNHPLDLPQRPFGSYLRLSVGGRDVPTYSVFRCEANWGFVMESCWGLYATFELPPRLLPVASRQDDDAAAAASDEAPPRPPPQQLRQRRRLRRTEGGGALWIDDDDDEDEDPSTGNRRDGQQFVHPSFLRLRDDSSLFITNEVQWREAFLYNVGALVLPDGDEATAHFDRAWQGGT